MDARDFFGYKHADEEPGRRDEADDGDDRRPPLPEEAITLDDPAILARIDASDMLARVRGPPRQRAQARRIAAATTLEARYREVDTVLVLGMGGSAIGGDLVAGIAAERVRVPLVVHRDYELPAWAGPRTLVIAASHSGETVETLRAAGEAREKGLPLVVISTGGELARRAQEDGAPLLRYEAPGQPRAAIGYGVGLLHELLVGAGLLSDPDPLGPVVESLDALLERNSPGIEAGRNQAKQLAWSVFGRIPVVYGEGPLEPRGSRCNEQLKEIATP